MYALNVLAKLDRSTKRVKQLEKKEREQQDEQERERRQRLQQQQQNSQSSSGSGIASNRSSEIHIESVVSGSQSSQEQEYKSKLGSKKRSRSSPSPSSPNKNNNINDKHRHRRQKRHSSADSDGSSGGETGDGNGNGGRDRGRYDSRGDSSGRGGVHRKRSSTSPSASFSSPVAKTSINNTSNPKKDDGDDVSWNSDDSAIFDWDAPLERTTTTSKKKTSSSSVTAAKTGTAADLSTQQQRGHKKNGIINPTRKGERVDFTSSEGEDEAERRRHRKRPGEEQGMKKNKKKDSATAAASRKGHKQQIDTNYDSEAKIFSSSSSDGNFRKNKKNHGKKIGKRKNSSSFFRKKTESESDSSQHIRSSSHALKSKRSTSIEQIRRRHRREKYYDTSDEEDEAAIKKYSSSSFNFKNKRDIDDRKWMSRNDARQKKKGSKSQNRRHQKQRDVDSSDTDISISSDGDSDDGDDESSDTDTSRRNKKSRTTNRRRRVDDDRKMKEKHRQQHHSRRRKESTGRYNASLESSSGEEDITGSGGNKIRNLDKSTSIVNNQSTAGHESDDLWSDPSDDESERESPAKGETKSRRSSSSATSKNRNQTKSTKSLERKKRTTKRRSSSSKNSSSDSSNSSDEGAGVSHYDEVTLPNEYKFGYSKSDKDLKPTLTDPKFGPDELVPLYLTRGRKDDNESSGDDHKDDDEDDRKLAADQQFVPASFNRYLAPFQREGVKFMYKVLTSGRGVIMGDEMGCGKTVQVIALLCALFNRTGTKKDLQLVLEQKRKAQENISTFKNASNAALGLGKMPPSREDSLKHRLDLSPWSPVLVIVPPSIVETWKRSLLEFSHFSVVEYTTQKKSAALEMMKAGGADIMLLRKSLFQSEDQFPDINEIGWKLVVIDEFHNYKRKSTKISNHMRTLKEAHDPLVVGMSGTLMQNNHKELWNLVDLIETGFLGNEKAFQDNIGKPISYAQQKGAEPNVVRKGEEAKAALQKALQTMMIERKKVDVLGEQLTAKTEEVRFCEPSPLQKEVYRHVVELPDFDMVKRGHAPCDCGVNRHFFQKFCGLETRKEKVEYWRNNKDLIVKQSKCCRAMPWNPRKDIEGEPDIDPDAAIWRAMKGHNTGDELSGCENCPFCCMFPCMKKLIKLSSHVGLIQAEKIPENEQRGSPAYIRYHAEREFARVALGGFIDRLPRRDLDRSNSITDDHYKLSGKLVVLNRLLTEFYEEGSRVLLFAHSTQLLDLIQTWLKSNGGYEYRRMDGQTDLKLRQHMADEYNKDDSIFLFLLSIKATGQGLTLTGANRVIIFDVDWNPSWEDQAQDRAHRIGQTKDVKVVRLISKGTIEEMVYLRQIYKNHLKKETLQEKAHKNESAPRLFRGVQGDQYRKGELFGTENLFRFKDGSFLETIWAQAGGGGRPNGNDKGRESMGDIEVHDTAKLSSALLGLGDNFDSVLEEKEEINDIATIASRSRKKTKTTNYSSDSESDAELDDTLNVKAQAVNPNDLMRSDRGGAKVAENDDEYEEEMGGGTQDAFQVYDNMAGEDLDEEDDADGDEVEEESIEDDSDNGIQIDPPAFGGNANGVEATDMDVDETVGAYEPTDIFKKFGQQVASSPKGTDKSVASASADVASSYPVPDTVGSVNRHSADTLHASDSRTIKNGILSRTDNSSSVNWGNRDDVSTLKSSFNVSDNMNSHHQSASANQDRSLSMGGGRGGHTARTLDAKEEVRQAVGSVPKTADSPDDCHQSSNESSSKPKAVDKKVSKETPNLPRKKGCSLFGCGNLDAVSTTFSAADLGLEDFSGKKKKKKSKKKGTDREQPTK
mmetsp:Transcript_44634/g.108243  ORF Transcript_44634/g.108243 Transcript_44634/m.108243 type:complete len:1809 (+) Transcript_44634:144-5570(+)